MSATQLAIRKQYSLNHVLIHTAHPIIIIRIVMAQLVDHVLNIKPYSIVNLNVYPNAAIRKTFKNQDLVYRMLINAKREMTLLLDCLSE